MTVATVRDAIASAGGLTDREFGVHVKSLGAASLSHAWRVVADARHELMLLGALYAGAVRYKSDDHARMALALASDLHKDVCRGSTRVVRTSRARTATKRAGVLADLGVSVGATDESIAKWMESHCNVSTSPALVRGARGSKGIDRRVSEHAAAEIVGKRGAGGRTIAALRKRKGPCAPLPASAWDDTASDLLDRHLDTVVEACGFSFALGFVVTMKDMP